MEKKKRVSVFRTISSILTLGKEAKEKGGSTREVIRNMSSVFKDLELLRRFLGVWLGIAAGIVLLFMSTYHVGRNESAYVTRLAKEKRSEIERGWHFKIPFVEKAHFYSVPKEQKMEFGMSTAYTAKKRSAGKRDRLVDEMRMITADTYFVDVKWQLYYAVNNPRAYSDSTSRNSTALLRSHAEAAMQKNIGDRTIDELLGVGVYNLPDSVIKELTPLCNLIGVTINEIDIRRLAPIDSIREGFKELKQAKEERRKGIKAIIKANRIAEMRASQEADRIVREAEILKLERISRAKMDSIQFVSYYKEYQKDPLYAKRKIYLETLEKVLPSAKTVQFSDKKGNRFLPVFKNLEKSK